MNQHNSLTISGDDKAVLESWLRAGKTEQRYRDRAKIILELHNGKSNKAVSAQLNTREATVSKWRKRFQENGIIGLQDKPRSGKPKKYTSEDEERILRKIDEPSA